MTEEEAKTKACCGAPAIAAFAAAAANIIRPTDLEGVVGALSCRASECMAWRWRREKETAAYLADVQAHMKATGENFNKATQKVWADKAGSYVNAEGYCGLAGRPE